MIILPLQIQLSKRGAINPAIFLTQNSIGLYRCSCCVHWLEMQINSSVLFNIGRIVDYQEILGPMYLRRHMGLYQQ
jgi:hypothetical protein